VFRKASRLAIPNFPFCDQAGRPGCTQGVKFEAGRASLAWALEIGQAAGVLITQACAKLAAQEAE